MNTACDIKERRKRKRKTTDFVTIPYPIFLKSGRISSLFVVAEYGYHGQVGEWDGVRQADSDLGIRSSRAFRF
jgi:hypothetical protein